MPTRPRQSDNPQLDLLGGIDTHPAEVHRLFFVLMPNATTRAQLARAVDALKASHPGLHARWINPTRYHATLHFLGDHVMLRQEVIDAAVAAADTLRAASFEWILHKAVSFHGRQPPCILCSEVLPEPLRQLWQDLRHALILAGQGSHIERSFTPHITVAYSHGAQLGATAVEPVTWKVDEIALIHSVVGQPDYQVLAHWSLQ